MFLFIFLITWVFTSLLAREVFRRSKSLRLAGICMTAVASFCFASFVVDSIQPVGNAVIDLEGIMRLARLAMYYVFVGGILSVIGAFLFFALARVRRAFLFKTRLWRVRASLKKAGKYSRKAERLMENGIYSDEVGGLLEHAKLHSDQAKWLTDRMQGINGPEPKRAKRSKTGTARRRLKKKTVRRENKGFIEWTNEA